MELRHYLQILGRRKWVVIAVATVTLLVVGVGTYLATPVYSASVTVRVAQVQDNSVSYYDLGYSERLINTYVELVRSRPFLDQTIQRLDLNIPASSLARVIKVESIPNTELLRITAQSDDPGVASSIANALGDFLIEQGGRLYSGEGKTAQEVVLDQLATVESGLASDRGRLLELLADQDRLDRTAEIEGLKARISIAGQTRSTLLDSYEEAR